MLSFQNERSKDRAAPARPPQKLVGRKDCRSWTSKGSCSKRATLSFEHASSQKGPVTGQRSKSPVRRDDSTERQYNPERQGKSRSRKVDCLPCSHYRRGSSSDDRQCDPGHFAQCKACQSKQCPLGKDCGCVHPVETRLFEESSTQRKRQRTKKVSEEVSDALVKIGNQRPEHKPWKSKQSEDK